MHCDHYWLHKLLSYYYDYYYFLVAVIVIVIVIVLIIVTVTVIIVVDIFFKTKYEICVLFFVWPVRS